MSDGAVTDIVVNHIGLCVHDIERSRRFYEDLLGFEYEHEIAPPDDPTGKLLGLEPPVGLRALYLRKDGLRLELLAYEGHRRAPRERAMDEPGPDPHLHWRRRRPGPAGPGRGPRGRDGHGHRHRCGRVHT
jgi:catechol 2,3-dioxygenase-like lactoylglutathione lyase family enzyme